MPTGPAPDRAVDRSPAADEVQQARRYATRLRQALTDAPGGSTSARPAGGSTAAPTPAARPSGRPDGQSSTYRWRITRHVTAPIQEPHVGLAIDTSGSMGAYEYALGPICWILTDGLRQIGGRCATALFGNTAALLRRRNAAATAVPRDRDRRRHRVRRRRDRAALPSSSVDQPAPPPLRLRVE